MEEMVYVLGCVVDVNDMVFYVLIYNEIMLFFY